jgi:hypothetical protein
LPGFNTITRPTKNCVLNKSEKIELKEDLRKRRIELEILSNTQNLFETLFKGMTSVIFENNPLDLHLNTSGEMKNHIL